MRNSAIRRIASAAVAAGLAATFTIALAVPAGATLAVKNDKFCKIVYGDERVSHAELLERVEQLVKERSRVWDGLRDQGWSVPSSEANFVWLRLGDATLDFAAACEAGGIIVRPFPGDGCRITVAEPDANDRLLQVAAEFRRNEQLTSRR